MFNHYYITVDQVNDNQISKIPKILHMVWVGARQPPEYFHANLTKWRELMPDWEFMVWTNDKLTHEYFSVDCLNLIGRAKLGNQKADIIKYNVIKEYGGFYVDADIIPYRSLGDLLYIDTDIILCHDLPISWDYLACGFFASIPNDSVFDLLCESIYMADLEHQHAHLHTGPGLFGRVLFNSFIDNYAMLHPHAFYRNSIGDVGLSDKESLFIKIHNSIIDLEKSVNDIGAIKVISCHLKEEKNKLFQDIFDGKEAKYMHYDVSWRFGSHRYAQDWFE